MASAQARKKEPFEGGSGPARAGSAGVAQRALPLGIAPGGGRGRGFSVACMLEGEVRFAYGSRLRPSGLTIRTTHAIEPGARVELRFAPPGLGQVVSAEAIAVSSRPVGRGGGHVRLKLTRLSVELGHLLTEACRRRACG